MRSWTIGLIAALAMAGSAMAQDVLAPVPGIEEVISRQMMAFEGDDFDEAFGFASPGIQRLFQNPDNFGEMVREGYPMVWRHGDVTFGDLRQSKGALWQRVIVTDSAGAVHALDYRMEQVDGEWRIAGVQIARMPEVSA